VKRSDPPDLPITERMWQGLILVLSISVIFLTVWCMANGITTVFMHLYYIPIVLLAYHYRKRGVIPAVLLSVAYFILVLSFTTIRIEIEAALIRTIVFISIALIVAYLSEKLVAARESLRSITDIQQSIIQNANVWLMVLDQKGNIREWNRAAEEISGYPAREVVGNNRIWRLIYPDPLYRKEITGKISGIIAENNYLENLRTTITSKRGLKRTILWNTKRLPQTTGEPAPFIAVGVDITEQTKMEEALAESEKRYSALFSQNYTVSLLIDPETGQIVDANDAAIGYYRYPRDQLLSMKISDLNQLPEDQVVRNLMMAKDKGQRHFLTIHYLAGGEKRNVEIYSGPITVQGRPLYYSIIHDITERKRAEAALQGSQYLLSEALEIANMGYWEYDVQTGLFTFNDRFYALYATTAEREGGYQMPAEVYAREFVHPADVHLVGEEVRKALETTDPGYLSQIEHRIIRRDGEIRYIIVRIRVTRDAAGRTVKTHGANQDITERRLAEEARKATEIRLDTAMDIGSLAWWEMDLPEGSVRFDDRKATMLGYDPARFRHYTDYTSLLHPDDLGPTMTAMREHLEDHDPRYHADYRIRTASGEYRWFRDVGGITRRHPDGKPATVTGVVIDITAAKVAEVAIRESRQLFSDIINFLPDATLVIGLEGHVIAWNRAIEQFSGIPAGDILGKGGYEYSIWLYGERRPILVDLVLHPDVDYARMGYSDIRWEGNTVIAETEYARPGRVKIPLSLIASPLYDSEGKIIGAIESMRDITRIRQTERELEKLNTGLEKIVRDRTRALEEEVTVRKQAEAAIQASLDEKILLLREIHHRVKNNLQIIISLTNLQMRTVDDPRMKQVMAEIRNRVRAMSIVHEKLYQSENIASIDMADYTKYLSTQLFSFYGVDHHRVGLETDIQKIPLDVNTAIPLGLILNELISNSLKHAFPDDRRGTLFISGHEQGDEITIVVRDNGAGLPPDLNWKETDSLGLRLITSLVDQLGATIEKGDGGGTMFIIRFHRKRDQGSAG
jgi:PAS domain S-box-containing protein